MSRPLPSGDHVRLGPFRLTARLTENAAGIVYLAVDDDGRRASVAVLSRDAAEDAAARDRFRAAIIAGMPAPGHRPPYGPAGVMGGAPGPVPGGAASTLTDSHAASGPASGPAPSATSASTPVPAGGVDAAGQERPVFAAPDGTPVASAGTSATSGAAAGGVAEIIAAQPDGPAPWVATAFDGRAVGAERFLEPVVPNGALRGRWAGMRRRGPLFQPYWAGGTGEPALARPAPPGASVLVGERPPERGLVAAILTLAGVLGVLAVLLLVLFACQPTVKTPPPQPPEPTLQSPLETPPPTTPATPSPAPTPTTPGTTPVSPDPSGAPGDGSGSV